MKRYLYILLALVGITACTPKFEEINTNPNAPENVDPQFLLTNIIYNAANNNTVDAWNAGNFLAQLTARFDFNEIDRWDVRTNTELWNKTYLLLRDTKTLIDLTEGTNDAYKGIALVMRAYLAATLTDLWNYVPYSQALQGQSEGNFTPIYDSQEAIYTGPDGILESLREAVALLQANQNGLPVSGDIMYNGNLDAWMRFANALRVRYLVRVSAKVAVSAELQDIVDNGLLMQNNQDNGLVPYLSTAPNQWFVHNIREGDYANVRMSITIDSILTALDDPRVSTLFRPTVNSQNDPVPVYDGIPNGVGPESRNDYDLAEVSTVGAKYRDVADGVDAAFMLYAEQQFCLAEAALNGLVSGSPQQYYEDGVQAAFEYLEVAMPADYLIRPNVVYDGNLQTIITQKWLSNFNIGYEGWLDIRRTGYPQIITALDNVNSDNLPVRYRYPDTEQAVNGGNYSAAVSAIGGDTYDSKGWWEQP